MRSRSFRTTPFALAGAMAIASGCSLASQAPLAGPASGTPGAASGTAEAAGTRLPSPPLAPDLDAAPGVAAFELAAGTRRVEIAPGRFADMYVYNGSYPGPTLDVREGDQVIVRFKNTLPEPTSVHWHGVPVPADQDDALETIAPGATREFRFKVPPGSAGTYWYHPHLHGTVAKQVALGLFGAVRVRAANDPVPAALGDEIAFLSDPKVGPDGRIAIPGAAADWASGVEGEPLVNGQASPRLTLRPGEARRVRLINASSARYYRLTYGGRPFTLLGTDGGLIERPLELTEVLLAPGERAEVVLRAPEQAGARLALLSAPYDRGAMGDMPAPPAGKPAPSGDPHGHGGQAKPASYAVTAMSPMPSMSPMSAGSAMHDGMMAGGMMSPMPSGMPMMAMPSGMPMSPMPSAMMGGDMMAGNTMPSDMMAGMMGMMMSGSMGSGGMGGGAGMGGALLEVVAEGAPAPVVAIPAQLRAIEALPMAGAAGRTFKITENHATADFRFNGQAFDPKRVDVTAKLGTTEVWAIDNQGDMDHPFHLHGFQFQVLDRAGKPDPARAWKDTVNLRRREATRIGVKFEGYPGVRVYHCHILEHEDRGMMGVMKVE